MKVMHVIAGARHGGAETYCVDLVCALARAGLDQIVVTKPFDTRRQALRQAGVETVSDLFRFPYSCINGRGKLARLIAHHRPQVVHAWMGRASSVLPSTPDVPKIGWFGGYYDLKRFKQADYFVGVTKDIAAHIVAMGVPAERVRTIHTFAPSPQGPSIERAIFDTPDDAPLLLTLARLHPKKGLDILLKATARIPETYLWIAGAGELEQDLKTLSQSLGLAKRVRFLGWRNDRDALFRAADLFVMPSRYEPFGTVMVEAWAARTPLIAAAAAGPRAYVHHGENGLMFPIDDVEALTRNIQTLLDQPALREKLVAGGLASYEKAFTESRIVATYLDFYQDLASRPGPWR